jgi:hypothetical protein
MKKSAKFMFMLLLAMLAFVLVGYAQDSTATGGGSTGTSGEGVLSFFFNISGLVLLVQIVTGWVLKVMPMLGATAKQLASWVISVGLAFVGQAYGYGMFEGINTIHTAAIGLGVGMVANHLYDAGTLDNILYLFFAKKKA